MDLIKEAFIEGYKQRAEASNLIFDNASRMYAIHLFDKWKAKQLMLGAVVGRSEQLANFCKKVSKQEDCPSEFQDIVNKEFWNLIG